MPRPWPRKDARRSRRCSTRFSLPVVEGSDRAAESRRAAQDARAPRGDRGRPPPGARITISIVIRRSSPTSSISTPSSLRATTRVGRSPSTWPPRAALSVDAAVKHAQSWGAKVSAIVPDAAVCGRGVAAQSAAAGAAQRSACRGSVGNSGSRLRLLGAVALVAIVLPVWQKREYAIAHNELAGQAMRRRRVSESLRSAARPRRSATTTSRSSESMPIRAPCRCSMT